MTQDDEWLNRVNAHLESGGENESDADILGAADVLRQFRELPLECAPDSLDHKIKVAAASAAEAKQTNKMVWFWRLLPALGFAAVFLVVTRVADQPEGQVAMREEQAAPFAVPPAEQAVLREKKEVTKGEAADAPSRDVSDGELAKPEGLVRAPQKRAKKKSKVLRVGGARGGPVPDSPEASVSSGRLDSAFALSDEPEAESALGARAAGAHEDVGAAAEPPADLKSVSQKVVREVAAQPPVAASEGREFSGKATKTPVPAAAPAKMRKRAKRRSRAAATAGAALSREQRLERAVTDDLLRGNALWKLGKQKEAHAVYKRAVSTSKHTRLYGSTLKAYAFKLAEAKQYGRCTALLRDVPAKTLSKTAGLSKLRSDCASALESE